MATNANDFKINYFRDKLIFGFRIGKIWLVSGRLILVAFYWFVVGAVDDNLITGRLSIVNLGLNSGQVCFLWPPC